MTKLVLGLALFLSTSAFAQAAAPTAPDYKRTTIYEFEDVQIGGETKGPSVDVIKTTPKYVHKNLVKVRTEFRSSILSSVAQL